MPNRALLRSVGGMEGEGGGSEWSRCLFFDMSQKELLKEVHRTYRFEVGLLLSMSIEFMNQCAIMGIIII